jgi:hypothetical protein
MVTVSAINPWYMSFLQSRAVVEGDRTESGHRQDVWVAKNRCVRALRARRIAD